MRFRPHLDPWAAAASRRGLAPVVLVEAHFGVLGYTDVVPARGLAVKYVNENHRVRFKNLVGATRFERATSSTPWKRATKLRHAPTRGKGYPEDPPSGRSRQKRGSSFILAPYPKSQPS